MVTLEASRGYVILRGRPGQGEPLNQYLATVSAPAPAEPAATGVTALGVEQSLRRQQDEERKRRLALQPENEGKNGGAMTLATASRDTGGSLHERRGRQF